MPEEQPKYDDEIDLIEFWNILVKQKLTVILSTTIITSIALAYTLITPPIYKSEAIIIKPTQEQIQTLIPEITTKDSDLFLDSDSVFSLSKLHINSIQTRRQVFNDNELLNSPVDKPTENKEELFNEFNKELELSLPVEKKGEILEDWNDKVTLSFQHTNPEFTADVINQFIKLAIVKSLDEIRNNFKSVITIRKNNLLRDITLLRLKGEADRQDRILRITAALEISEKTDITQPVTKFLEDDEASLYYRSPKSLKAEINQLQNRKSNDPFIDKLRDKQNELQRLELLQINTENATTLQVDQPALIPHKKFKPRRSLIVALGFGLGLILGIFIAFIRNYTSQRKES